MKYHAKLIFGNQQIQTYTDWDKDRIIEKLLIPFINGQVVYLKSRRSILNLKNVTELKLYRTNTKLGGTSPTARSAKMLSPLFEKNDCTEELITDAKNLLIDQNTTSVLQKTFAIEKNQVFVIMKFGDDLLDSAYEGVIKPLAQDFDLIALRVDEIEDSGENF